MLVRMSLGSTDASLPCIVSVIKKKKKMSSFGSGQLLWHALRPQAMCGTLFQDLSLSIIWLSCLKFVVIIPLQSS